MFHLILYQPEIPPNTGNIIRLAANSGTILHLVEPLGFRLDDKQLVRAGLDYHEFARLIVHADWAECRRSLPGARLFALTTRATRTHVDVAFEPGDAFVLGPESRGLPQHVLDEFPPERRLRIPMRAHSRSLNLSNAAAIVIYEAWRQHGFADGC